MITLDKKMANIVSGIDNKEKNDICVISYPDYKDTEIYMKVIDQLSDLRQDFIEINLDTFDIGFNKQRIHF